MKKSAIAAIAILSSSLFLSQIVFAKDATNSTANRVAPQQKKEVAQNRLDELKAKIASREAALKLKLQTFKDQKKATVTARINENLNKINQNQTSQMQKYLANMSSILDRLEKRVNSNTPDIKDATLAKDAIAKSRATIASVSAALTLQSQRDYTITLTSEAKVKQDAQKVRDQLHKDLQDLRKALIDAKQSVSNAIRVAKSDVGLSPKGKVEVPGKKKEGTVSGQQ